MGTEVISDFHGGRLAKILIVITVMVLGQYDAAANYTLTDCMNDSDNITASAFTNPFNVISTDFTTCKKTCLQDNNCISFYYEIGTCQLYSTLFRMVENQLGDLYFKCLACENGWYYHRGLCYGLSPNCTNIGAVSARFYGSDNILLHVVKMMNKPVYVREIVYRNGAWTFDTYNNTFLFTVGTGENCMYANITMPLINANCCLGLDELCEKEGKSKYQATKSAEMSSTFPATEADHSTVTQTITDFTSTINAKPTSLTTPDPTVNPLEDINTTTTTISTEKTEITTTHFQDQSKAAILSEIQQIDSQTNKTTIRKLLKKLNPYMTNLTLNETQVMIIATNDLVNHAIKANYSKADYTLIIGDVANLTNSVPTTNEDLKLALSGSMLKITNEILMLGKEEQEFYFPSTDFVLAGVKTDPQNLDGLNLKTEYGEVNLPDSMKEAATTMYFKMISYKDPILEQNLQNKTQSSTVYISLEDGQHNAIPNPDPDRTYGLVLKCETLKKKAWHDTVEQETSRKFAYQIPLTKTGLCLVELSSSDIAVWGKMNEAPTKYNYHFYFSALGQDRDIENIVKISSVKIEKYARFLRIVINSNDPQTILYLLIDHGGSNTRRLQRRTSLTPLKIRSVTVQPMLNRKSIHGQSKGKYEPFDIQDTSIDENYNVILKTNLFGTFTSVISFITPEILDFEKIFVNFDQKVMNNSCVLIVLLLIFLSYCILAIMVRYLDKKDKINWQYLPLADNVPSDSYVYLIRVYTGVRSSRIMTAIPYFILKGKKGLTDIRILDNKTRHNLGHGTVSYFLLRTDMHLGTLLSLKIWHDDGGPCPKWFLSNIDIKDTKDDKWYSFPCNDWLSFDKGDGSIIRQLEPHSNQSNNLFTNIKTRIHIGFFDDHLYFSIVKRPRSSHFTRVQRLSTLVAVLYLSLISSAMYYKPNDKTPSRAFTFGPFTLTSKEIVVGMISSVIMILPTSIIITLFKCRKVKGEELDTRGQNSLTIIERLKQIRLPWWSVFLAYLLVFLSISVSAFFTFMYSIVWGKKLALKWLLSIVINVALSILLVQPLKIGIIALLCSYFFQLPMFEDDKNVEISDFGDSTDTLQPEIKICPPPNMLAEEWKHKKQMMKLDHKLSKIFQTFFFRLFYVIVLVFFITNERITTRFHQNNAVEQQMRLDKLKQTQGVEDMWNWIETVALPVIFPFKNNNGQVMLIDEQRYLADQANKRLGAVRFRQIRSEKGWSKDTQIPGLNETKDERIQSAFRYTSSSDSGEYFNQRGTLEYYQNGGYIVDIIKRHLWAKQILLQLRDLNWMDEGTRCLLICIGTYNANTGLYTQTIIQLERLSVGGIQANVKAFSLKLYPFVSLWDYLMLLILIVFVCLTLGNVLRLFSRFRKRSTVFTWSVVLPLMNILFSMMIIFGFIFRIDHLLTLRDELVADPDKYVSADSLIVQDQIYLSGLCGCILIAMLSLLEPMTFNYQLFLMKGSISISMPSLLSFAVFLAIIISGFAFSLHATMCSHSSRFKDLRTVYLTLVRIFLLMGKFHETFQLERPFTHVVFLAYGFTVSIIMLNICVSIINDSFASVRDMQLNQGSKYKFDQRLNDHFWNRMRSFFSRNRRDTSQKVCQVSQEDGGYADIKKVLLKMDWIIGKAISDYEEEGSHTILTNPFARIQHETKFDQRRLRRTRMTISGDDRRMKYNIQPEHFVKSM